MSRGETSPVCERCGWYKPAYTEHRCNVEAGKLADAIAERARKAGYPSTKLGYGDGKLTIYSREPRNEEDIPPHVTLDVDRKRVSIDNVWSLDTFTEDDIVDILMQLFSSRFVRPSK